MTITGEVTAVGQSYLPVKAYVFIHLSQVSLDGSESFNAVADQPVGKAATEDGAQNGVTGGADLNIIKDDGVTGVHNLAIKGLLHSEVHVVHK